MNEVKSRTNQVDNDHRPVSFQQALRCYRSGDLPGARQLCTQIIASNRNHINALKLSGVIFYNQQRLSEAGEHLHAAYALQPNDPETNTLLGSVLMDTGNPQEALAYFLQSTLLDPKKPESYLKLGECYLKLQLQDSAQQSFIKALNLRENTATACIEYTNASLHRHDIESAAMIATLARKRYPENLSILQLEANINTLQGNYAAALPSYQHILSKQPGNIEVLSNSALCFEHLGEIEQAKKHFIQCLSLAPDFEAANTNYARILVFDEQAADAVKLCQHVLALNPKNCNAWINLSLAYQYLNELELAIDACKQAIKLEPHNHIAHYNLGNAYYDSGEFDASINTYQIAQNLKPDNKDIDLNLALALLVKGDLKNGWHHYFQRARTPYGSDKLSPFVPCMDISEKHIFITSAQGIGDSLFFARYMPTFRSLCKRVTVRCEKKIAPLFEQFSFFDHVITSQPTPHNADLTLSIDDIPLFLQAHDLANIPSPPRLQIDEKISSDIYNQLEKYPKPWIGLTWRAGTAAKKTNGIRPPSNNLSKEIELDLVTPIFKNFSGSIVILQRDPTDNEVKKLKAQLNCPIIDQSNKNDCLTSMLALLATIDDYIGVSNTNMHLLATINKAAKVLIPSPPEWRWMDLPQNSESPWMKGFQTFRQQKNNSWNNALRTLKQALLSQHKNAFSSTETKESFNDNHN